MTRLRHASKRFQSGDRLPASINAKARRPPSARRFINAMRVALLR
jgi:hypothetical protein